MPTQAAGNAAAPNTAAAREGCASTSAPATTLSGPQHVAMSSEVFNTCGDGMRDRSLTVYFGKNI